MIGFYDYTVVLTYVSFVSAVAGIFCASSGQLRWAIFFLAFSGFCDMFDGKIARTKKNRTEDEKNFGIQIDSLCDIVCFGALPILICYRLGMDRIYSMVILALYGLAGLIRLGYFNVMEAKRQAATEEARKYYQGLPITSMAIALPLLFVVSPLLPGGHPAFVAVLHVVVALVGFLFVLNFKMPKPSARQVLLIVVIVAAAVTVIVFAWRSWYNFLRTRG